MMTEEQAQDILQGIALTTVATASLQDIKRMRQQCLDADIPAMMRRPCTKGG